MLRTMSHSAVASLASAATSALLLSVLLPGCAYGEMRQVLRAEVASEVDCPEVVVTKVPAYAEGYKENQYKVTGCGVDRVYTCNDDSGGSALVKFGDADCKYVAVEIPKPPTPAAMPPSLPAGGDLGGDDDGAGLDGADDDSSG